MAAQPLKKKRILIIISGPARGHMGLRMFVRTLAPHYNVTIFARNAEEAKSQYPEADAISSRAFHLFKSGIKRAVRFGRRRKPAALKSARPEPAPVASSIKMQSTIFLGMAVLGMGEALTMLGRARRMDLIVTIDGHALLKGRVLSTLLRKPLLHYTYEIWPNQSPDTPRRIQKLLATLERWGVRGADIVASPTSAFTKLYARRYKIPRNRAMDIYMCPEPQERYADLYQDGVMRFYYCGNYFPHRGLEELILAMRSAPNAHLYFRGFGPLERTLRALVEKENLEDRISFLDPTHPDQLVEGAKEFHVGVLALSPVSANGRFGYGYKTFEYIAAGLGLMVTETHSLKPLLNTYGLGIGLEGSKLESLTHAFRYCVEHPEEVKAWMLNSRELARTKLNAETQGKLLRDTVESLLKGSS